jgi:hypothetical protein
MKSRIYVDEVQPALEDIAFQLANWEIENYPREFDCNSPFIMAAKLSVQPSGSKIEPRKVLSFFFFSSFVVYSGSDSIPSI